ncbi:hypothetical protein [Synechococcus sp. CB0205]|uniref:hypothetical protein n=1 Tax=Synechococcus sp. CB0205 TaxID=232363 RepID=UPI00020031A1|nr:hypothetical protein [Synechococcus sp. CB0205]
MRFYAVSTEAVDLTYRALQQLDRGRTGSRRPSRALRVATLFGHLQFRARGGSSVQVGCRQLAEAWHLHPREIRADLLDLEAIGWLSFTSSTTGLCIRLHEPQGPCGRGDQRGDVAASDACTPEPQTAEVKQDQVLQTQQAITAGPSEPSAQPESTAPKSPLIAQFTATYNQHKPQSWPAYHPTGSALVSKLQKAIRHAGGAEAFWSVLISALRRVPDFWRVTYPQGRSGSDCAMALLSADRKAAGLGVEFWHVFCWGASDSATYTQRLTSAIGGNTPGVGQKRPAPAFHPDHLRACELLLWDGHEWKGKGMAGRELPASEKQHLAEVLEAAGFGTPGKAAEQFAEEARR